MKKRFLSTLLALCLLCALLPASALPASAEKSDTDIAYPVEGGNIYFDKAKCAITDCDETVTRADIPAQIEGINVMKIGEKAFADHVNLTDVTIASSLFINISAFEGCTNLTCVTLPQNLKIIDSKAFSNCFGLTSITLPDNLTTIEAMAFEKCAGLTNIDLPDSLTDIGSSVFENCTGLTDIVIPDGITSIKNGTFRGCTGLTSVTIPDSVTSIVQGAFGRCSSLTSITIPNGVTEIQKATFADCKSLTSVTLPAGLITIDQNAFQGCGFSEITLPDSLTTLAPNAFILCKNLTSITIPAGVTTIGDNTFSSCSSLSSVTLPSSITGIGSRAFASTALTNITIPKNVTSIGDQAFLNCTSLTGAYFCGNAPEMGKEVFSVLEAESFSFVNNPNLTLYYIEGKDGWTTPTWNGYPTATWDGGTGDTPHIHSYTTVITAPTCTEKGYTPHTCECGDSYVDTFVDALGHAYGEWAQTKAPTCAEKGEEKRTCSRCDAFETREIAAHGHTEVIDAAVPATCTEAGKTEGKHCSVCNTVLVEQKTVPALGHDYKDGVCTRCGENDSNAVPPIVYADVSEKAWYYDAVQYATQNGLMNGVGGNKFDPNGEMTRAMLVTVLWRYEGQPMGYENKFTDVNAKSGSWYINAVAWAAENNIVNGVGGNKFDPNGDITREQMAAILFRYANGKNIDTSKRGDLTSFPDANQVSAWAKDAVQWTVAEGIINGSDGKLLPKGNATRAQVSTILMRFIENIVKE